MHYIGGKFRIKKQITEIILSYWEGRHQSYYEPFIGGCNIAPELTEIPHKFAYDKNKHLITLYKELQMGWIPPSELSEQEYTAIKNGKRDVNDPLVAFVGFGISYSGKWFAGYSRDPKTDRNYCLNAKNSLMKLKPKIQNIVFQVQDFNFLNAEGCLIYCDPPYSGTTQCYGVDRFDSGLFWDSVRRLSQNNTVLVSEYTAPADFACIAEIHTKTDISTKHGKESRTERVFKYSA
jgi:DNA adenine methylase